MERNTEYRLKMRAKRKKERRRRAIMTCAIVCFGLIAAAACLGLLLLRSNIKKEHQRAVDDYNAKNWQTVSAVPGGKSIEGCIEGEPYSYVDNGTYFAGISVDGLSLEGLTYSEAREMLIEHVSDTVSEINMTLQVENACMVLSASDLDISVNVNDILAEAFKLGREEPEDYAANYRRQQELKLDPVNYTIDYAYNREAIAERVANIAHFVNTEPKEPYATVSKHSPSSTGASADIESKSVTAANGHTVGYILYHPGVNGYTLDQDALIDEVIRAFDNGEYKKEITAELHDTAPQRTVEDVKNDVKLISSYTSKFESSNLNRRRNIQKAADILNACTVGPWQEISFNEYVGPRTEAGGWLPAPGITGGTQYEDSPGGGICQVSGTLYNALLAAGPNRIEVTKRSHHSWPSTYLKFGLDATVDTNGPDLCWKNVSDNNIFIFTYADVSEGSRVMYVYIFGKPQADGSYYKTDAETIEEIDPEPTIYENDPMLPAGTYKTITTPRKGYTCKAYLIHYAADGSVIEQIYIHTDYYKPVQGRIKRGTGGA